MLAFSTISRIGCCDAFSLAPGAGSDSPGRADFDARNRPGHRGTERVLALFHAAAGGYAGEQKDEGQIGRRASSGRVTMVTFPFPPPGQGGELAVDKDRAVARKARANSLSARGERVSLGLWRAVCAEAYGRVLGSREPLKDKARVRGSSRKLGADALARRQPRPRPQPRQVDRPSRQREQHDDGGADKGDEQPRLEREVRTG